MIELIIADAAELFLLEMQEKLQAQNPDYRIQIVSDVAYLETLFSAQQKIDLLVLSEPFYQQLAAQQLLTVQQLPANRTFVLSDCKEVNATAAYISVPRQQPATILSLCEHLFAKPAEEGTAPATKLIAVHSPLGRCGKTTIAMALAHKLSIVGQRTLFLSMDRLQSFNWLLNESFYLTDDKARIFTMENDRIAEDIPRLTKHNGFFYVPPFSSAQLSLPFAPKLYLHIITQLLAAEKYDCIVLDMSCPFSKSVGDLLTLAYHTVMITLQDANSVYKLNRMLLCLDDPFRQTSYLCNLYHAESTDARSAHLRQQTGDAVILYDPAMDGESLHRAENNPQLAQTIQEIVGKILSK